MDYFRIPPQWFTTPILAGTKLGRLRNEIVASSAALAKTRVVAVPGHDTACAYDAMPASPDGTDLFLKQVAANSTEDLPVAEITSGTQVRLKATRTDGSKTYTSDPMALNATTTWRVP